MWIVTKNLENNLVLFCKAENAHILPIIISTFRDFCSEVTLASVHQNTHTHKIQTFAAALFKRAKSKNNPIFTERRMYNKFQYILIQLWVWLNYTDMYPDE